LQRQTHSTSPEARPAVTRVTPPPSPEFKDVQPSSPTTGNEHLVEEYVIAHTPPPSRKASQPELDAGLEIASSGSENEHDPSVTNPFIVNAPYVKPPVHIDYGSNLHIGAGTFINRNFIAIDSPVCHIRIGERCQFGPNVMLAAVEHPLGEYREFPPPIVICATLRGKFC
jgi:acetyltransferase-like isoleucine patch superfamily enzyme